MNKILNFAEIKPIVRFAQHLVVRENSPFNGSTAYDHRFFYCSDGEGTIYIEGNPYKMTKGCVILWRSGLRYDLVARNEMCLAGCNFDYTYRHSFLQSPIPPGFADFDSSAVIEQISFSDTVCLNDVVYLNNMNILEPVINQICTEYDRHVSLFREKISALFMSLLADMVRECALHSDGARKNAAKVQEILSYIVEHHYENINNNDLGIRFGYHPNYINHLVVEQTGMSLHKYLLNCRINRAISLLQSSDLSASQISDMIGFADYNHFLKYFKQTTGHSTKEFRGK